MRLFSDRRSDRWLVLDQSFFSMFITFSLIELANVGAGLIDGLIVSNFLDASSMAAAGIAHPIFSISGIFGGMFAAGMQTLCTRELGKGDVRAFNRLFSAVMILGTGFSAALTAILLIGATPLAMLLGASGKGASLAAPAALYLRGVGIGLPALIMTGLRPLSIAAYNESESIMFAWTWHDRFNRERADSIVPFTKDIPVALRLKPGLLLSELFETISTQIREGISHGRVSYWIENGSYFGKDLVCLLYQGDTCEYRGGGGIVRSDSAAMTVGDVIRQAHRDRPETGS